MNVPLKKGDACACDRCGKSGDGMDMGAAVAAGWFFTLPTAAPDAPDAYCPECAEFLSWSFRGYSSDRMQRCGVCDRKTSYARLKAGVCIDCIFADAQGRRRIADAIQCELNSSRATLEEVLAVSRRLAVRVREMLPGVPLGMVLSMDSARKMETACKLLEQRIAEFNRERQEASE